ncbi:AAA family ATPase [Streptomyces sp. NPDC005318]|uniref:ATP-binding protein n=1 Tax=Streptomyces sp. NPDC005318 TaxID=3157031 RepID=UPI0033BC54B0
MTQDPQDRSRRPALGGAGVPLLGLCLLGGFRAERGEAGPVAERWRRPSARTVVKMLALAPGHRLHRDQVTEACWPDADLDTARRSLRVSLHTARHTLEPELAPRGVSSYLATDGDLLSLVPGAVEVDVVAAERAAVAALDSGSQDALAAAWTMLSQELLPEDRYAVWADTRRRELASLRRRLALVLADLPGSAHGAQRAVWVLEREVAADELDEALHRRLMGAHLAAGDHSRAAEQYGRLRELLHQQLGTAPEPETQELYRRAVHGAAPKDGPRTRPAPSAPPAPPAALRRAEAIPLRGRASTLAAVLAGLPATTGRPDGAGGRGAPLTVVSGESGVGKTRLAAEAARVAAADGIAVLWGAAHEAEGPLPYGAIADALSGWFADRPPAERTAAATAHPELGALLPAFGTEPPPGRTAEEERARLYRAVGALLASLAEHHPVLVVLDDLHAADLGTLRLLHHLVRTVGARPVRFLATLREEDLNEGDERRTVLAAATRQGLVHRVELMRLARADCDLLAADVARTALAGPPQQDGADSGTVPSPLMLDSVYRLSRGNPLFAAELVRVARESADGGTYEHPHRQDRVPESVREVVALRVARFAPHVRKTLGVLAAAGGEAALAEAAEVALSGVHPPIDGPAFTAALDALVAAGVIDECRIVHLGRRVEGLTFRHPVVGLAVYERLTSAARRQLHLAHAEVVRRHRPEAVEALAHHLDRADAPEATVWLRRAAERAAHLYADDSAARYYADLVARLDTAPDDGAEAARTRLAWAGVLVRQARHAQAEQVLRAALKTVRRLGDQDTAVRAAALLAEVLGRAGRPHEGIELLDDPVAVPVATTGPDAVAAHHLSLAQLWFLVGRYDDALASAAQAVLAARSAATDRAAGLLGRALHVRSACLLLIGRQSEARAAAEEALPIAEQALGDLSLQALLLSTLRELAEQSGRFDQAEEYARKALVLALRTGDPAAVAFSRASLARVHLWRGRLDEAREEARTAIAEARPYGSSWCLAYCLISRGEVELRTGELAGASRWLNEGAASARQLGDHQAEHAARVLLAQLDLAEGEPQRALARLREAGEAVGTDAPAPGAPGATAVGSGALILQAEALLASGSPAEAAELARRALARTRAGRDRPAQVEARRVLALALHHSHEPHEAQRQLRGALRLARAMGHRTAEERLMSAAASTA